MGRVFRGNRVERCRAIFPWCRDGGISGDVVRDTVRRRRKRAVRCSATVARCGSARSGRRAECGRGVGRFSAGKRFRFRFGVGRGNRTKRRRCFRPSARAERFRSPDPVPCRMHSDSSDVPQTVPRRIRQGGLVHRLGTSATGRARKRFRTRSSEKNRPRRKPFLRGRDVVSGPDLGPDGGF